MTGPLLGPALAGLLALAAPAPQPPDPLAEVLADRRYRFCHDARYPLTREELAWCDLVPKDDARCPALRKVCLAGARADLVGQRNRFDFQLPELPAVGRTFLWLLIGVAIALAIWVVVRNGLALWRPTRGGQAAGTGRAEGGASAGAAEAAAESDVFRLLEQARAAAAAGDFQRALERTYAALLRKLEAAGLIRLEAHRTNGDYLEDLRRQQPGLRPRVAAVVTSMEQVEFGGEVPEAGRFRWMHDRVVALCAETLTRALGICLLVTGLLVTTAGCQPEREGWEDSPSGHSAVLALLRKNGHQVRERFAPLARIGQQEEVAVLVLLPGATVSAEDWKPVEAWVREGGKLVVAGREQGLPGWLAVSFDRTAAPGNGRVNLMTEAAARLGRLQPVVPAGWRPLTGPERMPLLLSHAGDPYALEGDHGDGRLIVFADDRLFSNAGLLAGDNARLLLALLGEDDADRIDVAGELYGVVAPHAAAAVTRGRLAPALTQLGLLLVLFFLYKGARFGRPHDPAEGRRRLFSDHVRALGLLYARARAGRFAREVYGPFAIERLGARLRLGGGRGLSSIAEGLALRTGRPLGEVMRLLLAAREPASSGDPGRAADAEALETLRALAGLLAATTHSPVDPQNPPMRRPP